MSNPLYQILRIRRIEEALANAYPEQEIRCPMHLSIGQEAIAVGVCENLRKTDKVFSSHRAHAHYLGKGGSLQKLVAELYGKSGGCCGGIGGSMHLTDLEAGFIASTAIVGGIVPIAVGSSWADKLIRNNNVTAVFFGDGCLEEGSVHEAFNFASLHKLAIIFVMENNGLAVTTKEDARKSKNFDSYRFIESYGITYWESSGQVIEDILFVSKYAIELARQGKPQFIEFQTERQRVHCGIEHEFELINDPATPGTTEEELVIRQEIEEAFAYARRSPIPHKLEESVYYV